MASELAPSLTTKRRGAFASARTTFLDCPFDLITMEQALHISVQAICRRERLVHASVNVAKLMDIQNDSDFRDQVIRSELITADGMGVIWGARLFGIRFPERIAGIDYMIRMLTVCADRGFRPYVLGAEQYVLEAAIANIKRNNPNIVFAGYHNGFFERDEEAGIADDIRRSKADCLFIAMPSPQKERFIAEYGGHMGVPLLMGVGGSVDVIAGHRLRAPLIVQRMGLEWLFRLLQEPRRMWRRYVRTNYMFGVSILDRAFRLLRGNSRLESAS
jgi:N-acetylglucosaminyldiphosphoundecaprenol N-acetyl-beta-D-mannosaminyltransferase